MSGLEDAVWVISPLTRAIETFLLSCPFTERLRAAARGEAVQGKIPKVSFITGILCVGLLSLGLLALLVIMNALPSDRHLP
jgi:hypothetical protein